MVRPVYSNVSVCLKNEEIEEKVEICGAEAVCVESPSHTINNSMDDTEHHCETCAQEEDHDVLSVLYHSRRVISYHFTALDIQTCLFSNTKRTTATQRPVRCS
jgi:hypothetical protein